MKTYHDRMEAISSLIVQVLPALSVGANSLTIGQLCKLFFSSKFATTVIQSYADETSDAASYMSDFICKYDMLPHGENAIIYLVTGHSRDIPSVLNPEENELLKIIVDKVITATERKGTVDLILDNNPVLCRQIEITVVATDISIHR